ncbi:MAG: MBL fold metallo-hydrolase [Clostridium sp.]|uniref:MBL fold metallo-hydrolase n=1 Tax=Clostridium sp. TaxID=1506 RepID=UPI003032E300
MIDFMGMGSAFNTKLGNTSAFVEKGKDLILIDCGCTVFHKIQELNLLKGKENINIIITHTHPDHAGSLGDIIFYVYYILKNRVNIFHPNKEHMENFLSCIGVNKDMYVLNSLDKVVIEADEIGKVNIEFMKSSHVKELVAYSFIMELEDKKLYYSGDTNELPDSIVNKLKSGDIKRIYQDTSGLDFLGCVHMPFRKLCEVVPMELRINVYCMHLDKSITKDMIVKEGFNIVEIV